MLGLFAPTCPVDLREKVWTESRLRWLIDQFGLERMVEAEFILPTTEFFPEPFQQSARGVRVILDRLCVFMDVDPLKFSLSLYDDAEVPETARLCETGERRTIHVAESQLEDQERLIATLAHEVAHDLLSGQGLLTGEEDDHEWVTDLLTAFLGVGIFAANTAVQQESRRSLGWEFWRISKHGYLPARMYGYAFAVISWIRQETQPKWAAYLGHDSSSALRGGLKYLLKTTDSLLRPDNAAQPSEPRSVPELVSDLELESEGERLAAIWELEALGEDAKDAVAALVECLQDRNSIIQSDTALSLAAIGPSAASAVPDLIHGLRSTDSQVRANCARAIGTIRPPLQTVGRDGATALAELTFLIGDESPHVVDAAAESLAQYGAESASAAERLVAPLVDSVVHCDYERIDSLLDVLGSIVLNPAGFLQAQLSDHDEEIQRRVLDALADAEELDDSDAPAD